MDNQFLAYLFGNQPIADWLNCHAAGAIIPNLNNVVLGTLPVVLPQWDEQREIIATLSAIERKIDLHRRKRAVLEELFKSLLHKLMTGEIRVSDLDLSALPSPSPTEEAGGSVKTVFSAAAAAPPLTRACGGRHPAGSGSGGDSIPSRPPETGSAGPEGGAP